MVTRLTRPHEKARTKPWAVSDAPDDFIQRMLRGIVGIVLPIVRLEGKVKMSQNRPATDKSGVIEGLRRDGQDALANAVVRATACPGLGRQHQTLAPGGLRCRWPRCPQRRL